MSRPLLCLLLPVALALSACDQLAVLDGTKAREADGFAVGSACRQAGRAIEDCFTMNGNSPKASVFAGWKDMNDYMIANKLDTVTPLLTKGKEATKDMAADAPKDDAKDDTKDDGKDGKDATDPAKADPNAKDGVKSTEIKPALSGTAAAALAAAASADPPVASATPAAAPAQAARPGTPPGARIVTPGMPGEANGVPGAPVIVLPSPPPRS